MNPRRTMHTQWGTNNNRLQIDGAMGSSGGGRVRELSVLCLHNNAIVARGILVTILHCGTPEPRLNAIYIVFCWNLIERWQHPDIMERYDALVLKHMQTNRNIHTGRATLSSLIKCRRLLFGVGPPVWIGLKANNFLHHIYHVRS